MWHALSVLSGHPWVYPALQVVHLIGLSALFGGLLIVELRALGWGRSIDLAPLARLVVPVALGGFALCALSGAAMFAHQPQELWVSGALRLKMLLIAMAGANALWFHRRGGPSGITAQDRLGRAQCLVSLALWVAVIVCGRWISVV